MPHWRVTLIDLRTDETFHQDVEAETRAKAIRQAESHMRRAERPGKAINAQVLATYYDSEGQPYSAPYLR